MPVVDEDLARHRRVGRLRLRILVDEGQRPAAEAVVPLWCPDVADRHGERGSRGGSGEQGCDVGRCAVVLSLRQVGRRLVDERLGGHGDGCAGAHPDAHRLRLRRPRRSDRELTCDQGVAAAQRRDHRAVLIGVETGVACPVEADVVNRRAGGNGQARRTGVERRGVGVGIGPRHLVLVVDGVGIRPSGAVRAQGRGEWRRRGRALRHRVADDVEVAVDDLVVHLGERGDDIGCGGAGRYRRRARTQDERDEHARQGPSLPELPSAHVMPPVPPTRRSCGLVHT